MKSVEALHSRLIGQPNPTHNFEEQSGTTIAEPNLLCLQQRSVWFGATSKSDERTALPKNLDSWGSARIFSPGTRALDVNTSEFVIQSRRSYGENLLIHGHACVSGLGRGLALEEQFATDAVSTVGANDDVGLEDFSRLEGDGLSGDVDGDDLGVWPIFSTSFVAELVEEFSDI